MRSSGDWSGVCIASLPPIAKAQPMRPRFVYARRWAGFERPEPRRHAVGRCARDTAARLVGDSS
ncbi:hypothetical protein AL036_12585 [Salipiger aestuarii]|nr:hypothetical protein AL036_12585 [Salipiger aestuarii]